MKKVAEKDGLKIQVIEFSDYVQPNAALASGDLDANSYQHKPVPGPAGEGPWYKFVSAGYTVNFPYRYLPKKIKNLNDLKQGAKFGIPNDPTNGGRVLLVLQEKGLIKLRPEAGLKATPLDVIDNPKKIKFVELDAAQLPRSLDDLDASAINTNFALSAGLNPGKDAIAQEGAKSPYVNLIAVREADKRQALGDQAGQGLPVGRSAQVHPDRVQGRCDPWFLKSGGAGGDAGARLQHSAGYGPLFRP